MKDASTGKLASMIFLLKMQVKICLEQMFEWMYCIDLNEKGTQIGKIDRNIEQLSKNDKGFLGP